MTDLAGAVERVWPGRGARFEALGGGITNHNVKVELDGETYVLRVAGKDTNLLGIDRSVELGATRAAAALGIGPEVVDFVEPEGWLVTRFIEGEIPTLERMREPETLERVGRALRAFHDGPPIRGSFDAFRVVEDYRETALARGGEVPPAYEWAQGIAREIEARRAGAAPVPCHNDLLNANFLDDGAGIRIVDWEYAGMGDRFFDLANFSINHELGDDERGAAPSRLSGRRPRRGRGGARAHALHVRLSRGDVGSRPACGLDARLRLRRVRERALRAARANRCRADVPGSARGMTREGRLAAPLGVSRRCSRR